MKNKQPYTVTKSCLLLSAFCFLSCTAVNFDKSASDSGPAAHERNIFPLEKGYFKGKEVWFENRHGIAVIEGDIALGSVGAANVISPEFSKIDANKVFAIPDDAPEFLLNNPSEAEMNIPINRK